MVALGYQANWHVRDGLKEKGIPPTQKKVAIVSWVWVRNLSNKDDRIPAEWVIYKLHV